MATDNYLPVLIIMAGVVGFAVFLLAFSAWAGRFSVKFYLVAMLFVLFDIEVVFMYPWATIVDKPLLVDPGVALIEMLVFVLVLFVGWIYIVRKGVFEWNR